MALTLEERLCVAQRALGRSVVAINPRAWEEASRKGRGHVTVGVKDTADLPHELLERVAASSGHLLLTVDRMADLGRSVDTELVNPLTYRPMTGSTSGRGQRPQGHQRRLHWDGRRGQRPRPSCGGEPLLAHGQGNRPGHG